MDRRTQLAFLLIAVILGFNLIFADRFAPKPRRITSAPSPDTLLAEIPPDTSVTIASEPPPPEPGAPGFPRAVGNELEIEVRTPLYRARLSPDGGALVSLELENFALASGERVNLIPQLPVRPGGTALGMRLRTLDATLDLTHARFDVVTSVPPSGVIELTDGAQPQRITMRASAPEGGAVVKHFIFDPARYSIGLEFELERGPALPRVEGYTLEWTESLTSTETNNKDDYASFKVSALVGEELKNQRAAGGFMGGKDAKETLLSGDLRWLSMKSKYFAVALIPETQESGTARMMTDGGKHWMGMELSNPLPWRGREREVYRVYAGPIDYDVLVQEDVGLEAIVELGWRWIRPISKVVQGLMNFLYRFIPNYGVIILIISVLSKLVFWPLSEKSFRSMREMQNLQPVMAELKKRYADDQQEMNRQLMQLYKQRGVNPLGGCMPLVVQMPIFFALYSALRSSIDLRSAPFVLWIDNLSAPDLLFTAGSFPFRLLPLLMGAAMILQSKMGSGMAPAAGGAGAQQQAIMKWAMPIVFIFIFYGMPSGLVLYWLVNTVLSVSQQLMINRKYAPASTAAAAVPEIGKQGGDDDAASGRGNGRQRRRGPRKGSRRVGSKPR